MRLYAITDRSLLPGEHASGRLSEAERTGLLRLAAIWTANGVEYVQLREKDLPIPVLTDLAREMATALRGSTTRLLVNGGEPGMAPAAGVHLPGGWTATTVAAARVKGMVSVACHAMNELRRAADAGADMALFSPIFATKSHPGLAGLGLEVLAQGCRMAGGMPVFALGGVYAENANACAAAGASGVAGIRMFLEDRFPLAEGS